MMTVYLYPEITKNGAFMNETGGNNKNIKMRAMDKIAYRAMKTFFDICALIPPATGDEIALFASKIWFAVDQRHRKVAIENITHAFADLGIIAYLLDKSDRTVCRRYYVLTRRYRPCRFSYEIQLYDIIDYQQ